MRKIKKSGKKKPSQAARLRALQAEVARLKKALKAKKAKPAAKSLKIKTAARMRKTAKRTGKRAVESIKKFTGGLTNVVAKGYKFIKRVTKKPRTIQQKEIALKKIGVAPYKKIRKRTPKQKRKIAALYSEFSEFTTRGRQHFVIVHTKTKATLELARKSGMAIYGEHIYVHIARPGEKVLLQQFMGEKVLSRTYYGKRERIFLGGASVFDRVVNKLKKKKLKPHELITGAFFGGPTFHKAIYTNIGDFLNYMEHNFVPHLNRGERPTKRNLARAKAALIKNLAIVEITAPEFMQPFTTNHREILRRAKTTKLRNKTPRKTVKRTKAAKK